MTMTIKELADELGVSKQAIQKRINNLPTNQQPEKVGGRYVLDKDVVATIRSHYNGEGPVTEDNQQPTEKDVVDNTLVAVVEDLKLDKIELFNSMKMKDKQIETLQKLLDQQQQLTLQANIKIKELETTLTETEPVYEETPADKPDIKEEPIKKTFWQRFFQ